ncbi:MAG: hypothetical protein M3R65_00720 [Gemmatimonadota bacterium]|nr:hypothetical protein [Gemmatimonadota bacterium]
MTKPSLIEGSPVQRLSRGLILAVASVVAVTCGRRADPRGTPVRLVAGTSDTIIVNSRLRILLPVQALDANGRALLNPAIRYALTGGDSVALTPDGELSCRRRGDAVVRATLARLSASFVVLCRPVEYVRIYGPLQFVLGDSSLSKPHAIPVAAYDSTWHAVSQVTGIFEVSDSGVAALSGNSLTPRARGITLVSAQVGAHEGRTGVHVYQRVASLAALDTELRVPPHQRLFAIPIRLAPGESRRHPLSPGDWMLSTQAPTPDGARAFKVRAENASCQPNLLNDPGRFGCHAGSDAAVIVYRPFARGDTASVDGYLLVRWLFR